MQDGAEMNKKLINPAITGLFTSSFFVIIIHFLSDYYGCKPGPCLANTIHNNSFVYITVFILVYIASSLVYMMVKR